MFVTSVIQRYTVIFLFVCFKFLEVVLDRPEFTHTFAIVIHCQHCLPVLTRQFDKEIQELGLFHYGAINVQRTEELCRSAALFGYLCVLAAPLCLCLRAPHKWFFNKWTNSNCSHIWGALGGKKSWLIETVYPKHFVCPIFIFSQSLCDVSRWWAVEATQYLYMLLNMWTGEGYTLLVYLVFVS